MKRKFTTKRMFVTLAACALGVAGLFIGGLYPQPACAAVIVARPFDYTNLDDLDIVLIVVTAVAVAAFIVWVTPNLPAKPTKKERKLWNALSSKNEGEYIAALFVDRVYPGNASSWSTTRSVVLKHKDPKKNFLVYRSDPFDWKDMEFTWSRPKDKMAAFIFWLEAAQSSNVPAVYSTFKSQLFPFRKYTKLGVLPAEQVEIMLSGLPGSVHSFRSEIKWV